MRKKSLRKNKREGEKMRKLWLPLTMIIAILIPYALTLSTIFPEKVEAVTTEKQVVLDEDYAKVEASYIENETEVEWLVEFEKKKTEQLGRVRLAIDNSDNGIGTVTNIRGDGLVKENGELATFSENGSDWFYSGNLTRDEQKGTLKFTIEKTEGTKVPIKVVIDMVDESDIEDEETGKEIADEQATSTETDANASQKNNEIGLKTEQTSNNQETGKKATSESEETISQVQGTGRALKNIEIPGILTTDILPRFDLNVSGGDPFAYYTEHVEGQDPDDNIKYPRHWTNKYTDNTFTLKGVDLSGNLLEEDGPIENTGYDEDGNLGENYLNYNYDPEAVDVFGPKADNNTPIPKVNAWGENNDFSNGFLDYGGVKVRKWVAPSENNISGANPVEYDVYLDIIGDTQTQPIDIVLVMDRSFSMGDTFGTMEMDNGSFNVTRHTALTNAVDIFLDTVFSQNTTDDPDLVNVAMVSFEGGPNQTYASSYKVADFANKKSDLMNTPPITDYWGANLDSIKGAEDQGQVTNREKASGGQGSNTPTSVGLIEGLEKLHEDRGARNAKKIMILLSDGLPTMFIPTEKTYSYDYRNDVSRVTTNYPLIDGRENGRYKNYELNRADIGAADNWSTNGSSNATNGDGPLYNYETNMNPQDQYLATGQRYPSKFKDYSQNEDQPLYGNGIGLENTDGDGQGPLGELARTAGIHTVAHSKVLFASNPAYKDTLMHTVGIGISKNVRAHNFTRNVLKNITGPDNYTDAADTEELAEELKLLATKVSHTVLRAHLMDETGEQVSFVRDPQTQRVILNTTGYKLDGTKTPEKYEEDDRENPAIDVVSAPTKTKDTNNDAIEYSNISVGANQLLRLQYTVQLNAAHQDGNFYPVNKATYLENMNTNIVDPENADDDDKWDRSTRVYFANPSIRYEGDERSLKLIKRDNYGEPIAGISFNVFRKDVAVITDPPNFDMEEYMKEQAESVEDWQEIAGNFQTDDDGIINFTEELEMGTQQTRYLYKFVEGEAARYEPIGDMIFEVIQNPSESSKLLGIYYQGEEHFEIENIEGIEHAVVMNVENTLKQPNLRIKKESDIHDGNNQQLPLAGATFELQKLESKDAEEGTLIARGTSTETGEANLWSLDETGKETDKLYQIEPGWYRLDETKLPAGHKSLLPEDVYWKIEYTKTGRANIGLSNGQMLETNVDWSDGATGTITTQVTNEFEKKPLYVEKRSSVTGELVEGAIFLLYREGYENPYGVAEQDRNSAVQFYQLIPPTEGGEEWSKGSVIRGLDPNEYYVKEYQAPDGHALDDSEYHFRVNLDGTYEVKLGESWQSVPDENDNFSIETFNDAPALLITHFNDVLETDLELEKVDEGGNALEGAKFQLDKFVDGEWETGPEISATELNKFSFDNLTVGKYRLFETVAPTNVFGLGETFIEIEIGYETAENSPNKLAIDAWWKTNEDDSGVALTKDTLHTFTSSINDTGEGKNTIQLSVVNTQKPKLPSTGGQGREHYFLIAAAVIITMGAVGAIYVFRNRKGAK